MSVRRFNIVAALTVICVSAVAIAQGQESDTAIFNDDRPRLTVLSEITDRDERNRFQAAYEATDPAQRHALAQAFIDSYPQSWLLAQAYDIAARSSIDLGHYEAALQEGRFSLRLMPENATLLVLIANVEARSGLPDQAERSARDALDYLQQFARPPHLSEDQWRLLQPQLRASAYFALGRAYTVKATRERTDSHKLLVQAEDALHRSVALNPKDWEAIYLRALLQLQLGETAPGESSLACVARSADPLSAKASNLLRQLYDKQSPRPALSFDEFLSKIPKPDFGMPEREEVTDPDGWKILRTGYAGSAACRECHSREYQTWRQTGMARMLREYQPENVLGDFSPGSEFREESNAPVIRMGIDSRAYFDVQDANGHWRRFPVDYTIGSKWQQGYATRLPDGTFHVLPIEYNALQKRWVNYWKIIDPAGSKRAIITDFPKLSPATNYQENCAICHTSQLRSSPNAGNPVESATFREGGVNCEMCHGPSAWHTAQMRKGHISPKPLLEPPLDFRKIGNREGVRVCAQCHRQSAIRHIGVNGEMNYAAEGGSFVPLSWSRPFDSFSRRAFYKDGRFRETTFIAEAFTRSACYRKGTAQCATCHAPHLPNFAQNQTSLKFKNNPNEMCLRCHQTYRDRIAEHTRHLANSEASQCVSCHMPRIVNALLFQARSHQIEVPRADLTKRFGQNEAPNACLLCHSNRDADWTERKLEQWRN